MWHELLRTGKRIQNLSDVVPGDVVFLTCDATPYLAFTVHEITVRDNVTYLWMSSSRHYRIGGVSTVTFETAIRPANHSNTKETSHEEA
ncbi:hypothetical protein [Bifidobacterium aerophilum]|uniref:Uncharacterized protein n=1 Tax=Bifidobacterium aerophilum TaxID=1798155 RepID=A0A6N9Z798_9BIFI|nr:hypothetical protein [Bifidobacterium aerophilum]NEG90579.1 hypothetical protein [Bifidobacterium aerophilum]